MNIQNHRIVVITGPTSGIGLALTKRLVASSNTHLCLLCRNKRKAENLKEQLIKEFTTCSIEIIIADLSDAITIFKAAEEIKRRYNHIDALFLNGGSILVKSINWKYMIQNFYSKDLLSTAHGVFNQYDIQMDDGLKYIFATNVFGHFILVKELEPLLQSADKPSQIIWTSSSNADNNAFSIDDIQSEKGKYPYSSSKYLIDILSYQINQEWNQKNIYSHTSCPGLVMTNLTDNILARWIWYLLLPFMLIMRIFVQSWTLTTYIGSNSLFWLVNQNPIKLDPSMKYGSRVSIYGKSFIDSNKIELNPEIARKSFIKLTSMVEEFKKKLKVE